jgi:hypothetical protein
MCACMPALRVILVHVFPTIMGSSRVPTAAQYYESRNGKSGNMSSAVGSGSRLGRNQSASRSGLGLGRGRRESASASGITYTKSFEVTHAMERGEDEEQLVRMEDLSQKGRKIGSSGSSVVSYPGAVSPGPPPPAHRGNYV